MKTTMKARLGAAAGALALAATGVLTGAGTASAEDSFSFSYATQPDGDDGAINVTNNSWNDKAGSAIWETDGDAISASDELPDGYGIEAHLSTGRIASTRGMASPAYVRKTGDLLENTRYTMWVCVVKASFSKCSSAIPVYS